ncbi:Uncharacterised protein r2_g2414 [Pycnogonum litorale]
MLTRTSRPTLTFLLNGQFHFIFHGEMTDEEIRWRYNQATLCWKMTFLSGPMATLESHCADAMMDYIVAARDVDGRNPEGRKSSSEAWTSYCDICAAFWIIHLMRTKR